MPATLQSEKSSGEQSEEERRKEEKREGEIPLSLGHRYCPVCMELRLIAGRKSHVRPIRHLDTIRPCSLVREALHSSHQGPRRRHIAGIVSPPLPTPPNPTSSLPQSAPRVRGHPRQGAHGGPGVMKGVGAGNADSGSEHTWVQTYHRWTTESQGLSFMEIYRTVD